MIGCSLESSQSVKAQTGLYHTVKLRRITADPYYRTFVEWSTWSVLVFHGDNSAFAEMIGNQQRDILQHLVGTVLGKSLTTVLSTCQSCFFVCKRRSFWTACYPILPHLWLGSHKTADRPDELSELGITNILNVTCHNPPLSRTKSQFDVVFWPLTVRELDPVVIGCADFLKQDSLHEDLGEWLPQSFDLIESGLRHLDFVCWMFARVVSYLTDNCVRLCITVRLNGGSIFVHCTLAFRAVPRLYV